MVCALHDNCRRISNLFVDKYEHLYNSVSYNVDEMNYVCTEIENNVNNICKRGLCESSHIISVQDVTCAIGRMKPFKADGIEATSSDILINACTELHVHLGLLFNSMLIHGVSPCNLLISTLVPIPKNKNKSLNDSDNYRAIALGSVVGN